MRVDKKCVTWRRTEREVGRWHMGASQERHGAGALPVFVIRVRASSYKFQVVNDRLWPVILWIWI